MRKILIAPIACLAFLGGCKAADVAAGDAKVQAAVTKAEAIGARLDAGLIKACDAAAGLIPVANLVPGAAVYTPFVTASCQDAEGLLKLALDPSSEAWVMGLFAKISTAITKPQAS